MRKISKKVFLYFIGLTINFSYTISSIWAINVAYWVYQPSPTVEDSSVNIFSSFIGWLLIPLIFVIWLFFYFKKKWKNKKFSKKK